MWPSSLAPVSFNNKFWIAIWMSWSEVGADRQAWACFNSWMSVQLGFPLLSSEPCKSLRKPYKSLSQSESPTSGFQKPWHHHLLVTGWLGDRFSPTSTQLTKPGWNPFWDTDLTSYNVWPHAGSRFAFDLSVVLCLSWRNLVMQEKRYSVVWWQKHAFGTRQTHLNTLFTLWYIQSTHTSWVPTLCPAGTVLGPEETMMNTTEKFLPSWSLHFSGEDWQ